MEQVKLSVEDRMCAMETLLKLNRKYDNRISANAGPLAEARMWSDMASAKVSGKNRTSMGGRLTACGCVTEKIAVRADGIIVPCVMLSHIELGRINEDNFKEIWRGHDEFQKIRDRSSIPLSEFDFCHECKYIDYCTGNCPALAYTLTGRVDHPSPDACFKRFLEGGGQLPVIEQRTTNKDERRTSNIEHRTSNKDESNIEHYLQ
jgi:SynChlorMet cassette radical SAM/SPASM protein ScmE